MCDDVRVVIEISLEDIGTISAVLDHAKPESAIQKRWNSLYEGVHKLTFGTYMFTGSVREVTIPKRNPI